MTRLRKANRNRRLEERKNQKAIAELKKTVSQYDECVNSLVATIQRERRETADRAQEIANQLLKSRHLNQVLDKIAHEFTQADRRNIEKWMLENRDFCHKNGIYNIEDAERYLQYNRNQRKAREQSAKFGYSFNAERKFNTVTLNFPALTYSFMMDNDL